MINQKLMMNKKLTDKEKKELRDFSDLQKSSHYRETRHNNRMGRSSSSKLNIILVMLAVIITYFSVVLYHDCEEQLDKSGRKVIWFDRQRIHPSQSFAKIDEKFPAGYEIWEGEKLIERWHWKIENDPRTHQFGDFILRCVAKYSDDGSYIGYTEYQMIDYPTEEHEKFESLRNQDAIVFRVSIEKGTVTLRKPTLKAKWRDETYLGAEKVSDGFPHSKNQVHASMLIENQTDLRYVEWVSERFKFLQEDVVNPYLSKKDFNEIVQNSPEKTQAAWGRFVESMNQDCEATQTYIENQWKNRKIEDTVSK